MLLLTNIVINQQIDIFLPSSSIKTAIHFSVNRILLCSKHGVVIHNAAKKENIVGY